MSVASRRNEIVKIFLQENKVKVGELARAMGVTTETIRKDLIALEQEGLIRRSNGRAEVCNQFNEQPFSQIPIRHRRQAGHRRPRGGDDPARRHRLF